MSGLGQSGSAVDALLRVRHGREGQRLVGNGRVGPSTSSPQATPRGADDCPDDDNADGDSCSASVCDAGDGRRAPGAVHGYRYR